MYVPWKNQTYNSLFIYFLLLYKWKGNWAEFCAFLCRPEILKQEIKVFFVKYNDPIYVKLEKLDIMIRLASQANIAQVRLLDETQPIFIFQIWRLVLAEKYI